MAKKKDRRRKRLYKKNGYRSLKHLRRYVRYVTDLCDYCGFEPNFEPIDYDERKGAIYEDYIHITNYHSVMSFDAFNAHEWTVEITCPCCGNEYWFDDSNY